MRRNWIEKVFRKRSKTCNKGVVKQHKKTPAVTLQFAYLALKLEKLNEYRYLIVSVPAPITKTVGPAPVVEIKQFNSIARFTISVENFIRGMENKKVLGTVPKKIQLHEVKARAPPAILPLDHFSSALIIEALTSGADMNSNFRFCSEFSQTKTGKGSQGSTVPTGLMWSLAPSPLN